MIKPQEPQALDMLKWQPLHYHRCLAAFKSMGMNGGVDFTDFDHKKNIEIHEKFTHRARGAGFGLGY